MAEHIECTVGPVRRIGKKVASGVAAEAEDRGVAGAGNMYG